MKDHLIMQAVRDRLAPTISAAVEIAMLVDNDAPREELKKALIKHFGRYAPGVPSNDIYLHPEHYDIIDVESVRKTMRGVQAELEAQQLDIQNGDRQAQIHRRRIKNTLKPIKDLFVRKPKPIPPQPAKPTTEQINQARGRYIGEIQAQAQKDHANRGWTFRQQMYVFVAEMFAQRVPAHIVTLAIDDTVFSTPNKDSAVVAFTYHHQIKRTTLRFWSNGGYPRFDLNTYLQGEQHESSTATR